MASCTAKLYSAVWSRKKKHKACGPGSPELSKSDLDMASKSFTFTYTFTFTCTSAGQSIPSKRLQQEHLPMQEKYKCKHQ